MLQPTNATRDIVEGWLAKSAVRASAAEDVPLPEFKPRQERLGLGAKFVAHHGAMSVQEQVLTKTLKAKPEFNSGTLKGNAIRKDDDSDDDDQGRSGSIPSKKRKPASGGAGNSKRGKEPKRS